MHLEHLDIILISLNSPKSGLRGVPRATPGEYASATLPRTRREHKTHQEASKTGQVVSKTAEDASKNFQATRPEPSSSRFRCLPSLDFGKFEILLEPCLDKFGLVFADQYSQIHLNS